MNNIVSKISELILSLDPINDSLLIGMLEYKKREYDNVFSIDRPISDRDFLFAKRGLRRHFTNEFIYKNKELSELNTRAEQECEYYESQNKMDEYYKKTETLYDEHSRQVDDIEKKISEILDSGEYNNAIELKALINNINKKLNKILNK